MNHQHGGDISEQRQGEPLQHAHIRTVHGVQLQQQRCDSEADHVDERRSADQQAHAVGHRIQIGGDIEQVCREQQRGSGGYERARIHRGEIGGQSSMSHAADVRAHGLDRDHQRQGEHDRPEQAEAKSGTRLRVSRDTRRIVVRRTGDEAGPELGPPLRRPHRARCDGFAALAFTHVSEA